jgi:hypothetical protein
MLRDCQWGRIWFPIIQRFSIFSTCLPHQLLSARYLLYVIFAITWIAKSINRFEAMVLLEFLNVLFALFSGYSQLSQSNSANDFIIVSVEVCLTFRVQDVMAKIVNKIHPKTRRLIQMNYSLIDRILEYVPKLLILINRCNEAVLVRTKSGGTLLCQVIIVRINKTSKVVKTQQCRSSN